MLKAFLQVGILSCGIFLSTVMANASEPATQNVVANGVAQAYTLANEGKMEEAYRMFFTLFREEPLTDEVTIGLARTAFASNHPYQAIMAYERLLARHPNESFLYKEIANVYMSIGDKDTADQYLLRDTSLSEGEFEKLSKELGKRYDPLQIRTKLRIGMLYDSNANQGPNSNNIRLGDWNVRLSDAKAVETAGIYIGGKIDMSYRYKPDGSWWGVGDIAFFSRGGFSEKLRDLRSEYSQWYRMSLGLRRMSSKDLFEMRMKLEVFDYDFYNSIYSMGPEFTYVSVVDPSTQLITTANIEHREYVRNNAYRGAYGSVGQYARFFFGKAAHEFMVGASYNFGQPKRHMYAYNGWNILASWRLKMSKKFELSPSVSYGTDHYKGKGTALDHRLRQDNRLRLGLGMVYHVNKIMSIEGSYQYTNNDSKSGIYDYDRHLVTLGCAWSF